MADTTNLEGFQNTQDLGLTNILLENFVMRYDWGFINKGGYYNINIPTSGIYQSDKSKLAPVKDPNFTDGKVWQSNRSNWVWETGVSKGTPISPTGVYVNNVPASSGYNIDYKNGRVVFDNPVAVSSNVRIAYSHKYIQVFPANDLGFFKNIQRLSDRSDNVQFTMRGSGDWAIFAEKRVQLPAVAIDVLPVHDTKPYQLGGGKWMHNNIMFYVIAKNAWEVRNILDIIAEQDDLSINLFNPNTALSSGVYPFDASNYLRPQALPSGMYPQLVSNFKYRDCYIFNTGNPELTELNSDLVLGTIKCTTEVRGN
jgi:hypothetical protein